jgi:hypothetical protein
MMNALIFQTIEQAEQEARKVEAWAKISIPGMYVSIPIPYQNQWAVTVPASYPCEGTVDINVVEMEGEPI